MSGGRPNLVLAQVWSLVLGPFGPDLGPDLDLTWDLDLSLTTIYPQTDIWIPPQCICDNYDLGLPRPSACRGSAPSAPEPRHQGEDVTFFSSNIFSYNVFSLPRWLWPGACRCLTPLRLGSCTWPTRASPATSTRRSASSTAPPSAPSSSSLFRPPNFIRIQKQDERMCIYFWTQWAAYKHGSYSK